LGSQRGRWGGGVVVNVLSGTVVGWTSIEVVVMASDGQSVRLRVPAGGLVPGAGQRVFYDADAATVLAPPKKHDRSSFFRDDEGIPGDNIGGIGV